MFWVSIILCVVFIVSVNSEPTWRKPASKSRDIAWKAIDKKINDFEKQLNDTGYRGKYNKTMDKLTKFSADVARRIGLTNYQVDNAYSTLTDEAKGINITECSNHYNLLKEKINFILTRALKCVQNAFEGLLDNTMTIDQSLVDKHSRFDDVERRIENCNAHIVDPKSAIAALHCTVQAKKDADAISSGLGRQLKSKISKLDTFLKDVTENLEICTDDGGLGTIDRTTSIVLRIIERCIEQKIVEAHQNDHKTSHDNKENDA